MVTAFLSSWCAPGPKKKKKIYITPESERLLVTKLWSIAQALEVLLYK